MFASLMGCAPQRPQIMYIGENSYASRTEKLNNTPWSADGDKLITPHRNDYYGTNGPIYVKSSGDPDGEIALDFANKVILYKREFSEMTGNEQIPHTYCRVDDFDNDGHADRISWPRVERMPVIQVGLLSKDLKEKADRTVMYENFIIDYIRHK